MLYWQFIGLTIGNILPYTLLTAVVLEGWVLKVLSASLYNSTYPFVSAITFYFILTLHITFFSQVEMYIYQTSYISLFIYLFICYLTCLQALFFSHTFTVLIPTLYICPLLQVHFCLLWKHDFWGAGNLHLSLFWHLHRHRIQREPCPK